MSSLTLPRFARSSTSSCRRERRLNQVIAEYLDAAQRSSPPDRGELLRRHRDLNDGLVSFFANEDRLKRAAALPWPNRAAKAPARHLDWQAVSAEELSSWRDFGDFELLNEIARGGMGVVFKARHKRLNRIVALKTIQPGLLPPTDEVVSRLRLEARVVSVLDHPNIVPLYEIGEHGGYPYLVLKLIPGGDLERHVPRLVRYPREAARIMARVARTVHYAHQHGVLHCDVKPSNILLDLRGVPHVADFGLARCIEIESGLTRTGLVIGTPAYMAPEQVSGSRRDMNEGVDIYGLGAVLYKLLTGRPPFQAATVYELLEQVREREPRPPRHYNPGVDRDLEAICLKCLAKEPWRRYRTAAALAADLERWRAGAAVRARRQSGSEQAARWLHENRVVVGVSAALVGLVMMFVLTAVATASIICHRWLTDEPLRPLPQPVEHRAAAAAARQRFSPAPVLDSMDLQ